MKWKVAGTEKRDVSNLLFTVPFTASTTNAMEMKRAMTSSVDLRNHTVTVKVVSLCHHFLRPEVNKSTERWMKCLKHKPLKKNNVNIFSLYSLCLCVLTFRHRTYKQQRELGPQADIYTVQLRHPLFVPQLNIKLPNKQR